MLLLRVSTGLPDPARQCLRVKSLLEPPLAHVRFAALSLESRGAAATQEQEVHATAALRRTADTVKWCGVSIRWGLEIGARTAAAWW